ncbi:MAG: type I-B CRISPR-associated protein Cas5b [Bacillota bacterium]
MEVLKLRLFQESACYKKPFAFKVGETYPLPPYSTVKGMLHRIIDANEFIPMQISIQGDYESKFVDYQSMYFQKGKETTKKPLDMHLLHNVELVIHVQAKEGTLTRIVEGIKNLDEYLSLGRREDLVRIDEIKFVELEQIELAPFADDYTTRYPIYIPVNSKQIDTAAVRGITYRLNWKYKIIEGLRQWEKIESKYVDRGEQLASKLSGDQLTVDSDGDLVCFNLQ